MFGTGLRDREASVNTAIANRKHAMMQVIDAGINFFISLQSGFKPSSNTTNKKERRNKPRWLREEMTILRTILVLVSLHGHAAAGGVLYGAASWGCVGNAVAPVL